MADKYDGAFRTVVNDCKQFLLPFINEVFGEHYIGNEKIEFHPNEHFIDQQDKADVKRITDTNFTVIGDKVKKYHLECESSRYSSKMLIRVFEYDAQIALDQAEIGTETLKVTFPHTAVLYLRGTATTPDKMKIVIETPGGAVQYDVPVAKIISYSIEDIFEKKLYILIPFYIFTYEKSFEEYNRDEEKLLGLKQEYQNIVERLNILTEEGVISSFEKRTLMELSEDVVKELTKKYANVQEGVGEIMSGALLETEARTILLQGRSEGIEQVAEAMLKHQEPVDRIMMFTGLSEEEIQKIANAMDDLSEDM